MGNIPKIDPEKIINPTDKVKLMYEAVSELVRQKKDFSSMKVVDITNQAGIGKGTAYEYFSSKEELLAHALLYEYSARIQNLAELAFLPEGFKDRIYTVMKWIDDNQEYNTIFIQLVKQLFGQQESLDCPEDDPMVKAIVGYLFGLISKLMDDGAKEGLVKEADMQKCAVALISAMIEYASMVTLSDTIKLISFDAETAKDFAYKTLLGALQ